MQREGKYVRKIGAGDLLGEAHTTGTNAAASTCKGSGCASVFTSGATSGSGGGAGAAAATGVDEGDCASSGLEAQREACIVSESVEVRCEVW